MKKMMIAAVLLSLIACSIGCSTHINLNERSNKFSWRLEKEEIQTFKKETMGGRESAISNGLVYIEDGLVAFWEVTPKSADMTVVLPCEDGEVKYQTPDQKKGYNVEIMILSRRGQNRYSVYSMSTSEWIPTADHPRTNWNILEDRTWVFPLETFKGAEFSITKNG